MKKQISKSNAALRRGDKIRRNIKTSHFLRSRKNSRNNGLLPFSSSDVTLKITALKSYSDSRQWGRHHQDFYLCFHLLSTHITIVYRIVSPKASNYLPISILCQQAPDTPVMSLRRMNFSLFDLSIDSCC